MTQARHEARGAVRIMDVLQERMSTKANYLDAIAAIRRQTVSDLVDADLERVAAERAALRARQQLALEALAISNRSEASILRLFRDG